MNEWWNVIQSISEVAGVFAVVLAIICGVITSGAGVVIFAIAAESPGLGGATQGMTGIGLILAGLPAFALASIAQTLVNTEKNTGAIVALLKRQIEAPQNAAPQEGQNAAD